MQSSLDRSWGNSYSVSTAVWEKGRQGAGLVFRYLNRVV